VKYSISLSDFYFLNPELNSNCTNLWANASYCILPVGDISTYAGYGGAATTTIPGPTGTVFNYSTLPTATWPSAIVPSATATGYPLANNTRKDCVTYYNNDNQTCLYLSILYNIALTDFVLWNPSTGNTTTLNTDGWDGCTMVAGKRYCAQLNTSEDCK